MYLLCPYVVQKRLNVSNSVIPIFPLAYRAGGGLFAMTALLHRLQQPIMLLNNPLYITLQFFKALQHFSSGRS
jgi:hypothetical protein